MTNDVFTARWSKVYLVVSVFSHGLIYNPCLSFRGAHPPQRDRRFFTQAIQSVASVDPESIQQIDIYDNLFDINACNQLNQLAISHSDRIGDDSTLFYRNIDGSDHSNHFSALEFILDGLLTGVLNDTTTRVVEYWSRQEFMNMDTHCDVDEHMLEAQNRVRCPEWAHILYLRVQPNITAPTCILPTKKTGWKTSLLEQDDSATKLDVVVVPAVSGRLVRFPGNLMHAVPKPPERWFLSKEDEVAIREQQQDEECSDSDVDRIERSVILFNCWSNTLPPPRGLQKDTDGRTIPDGIVFDDDDEHDTPAPITFIHEDLLLSSTQTSPVVDNWHCTPIENKIAAKYLTTNQDELRIRLMGNQKRRKHPNAVVTIHTHAGRVLWDALHEPHHPTYIQL